MFLVSIFSYYNWIKNKFDKVMVIFLFVCIENKMFLDKVECLLLKILLFV